MNIIGGTMTIVGGTMNVGGGWKLNTNNVNKALTKNVYCGIFGKTLLLLTSN